MAGLPQSELIYFIIIGSLGMLVFVVGFAVFIAVYQKRMLQEQEKQRLLDLSYQQEMIHLQIRSQEIERKRIAADLHDSIGSLLWAAKLNVTFLGRSLHLANDLKDSYEEVITILDQSIDSVKRISWGLTPDAFQNIGLSASIAEMCLRINGKGLSVMFHEDGDRQNWNDEQALMLFRIVQELVNNAVKHAQATKIDVKLSWKGKCLLVLVSDDGIGFDLKNKERNGVGWWNIEHRAKKIGASIVQKNCETGTRIELNVPL